LLTGAEDRIAMLWDVKDGSRVSILRGNDFPIKYVAFSKNDQFMFTSDKTSNVAIWRNQKPSEINSLMKLSPFELYQRGVNSSDITAGSVYKIDTANTETTSLSGVTLHYLLSLPQKNLFPEDENFSRGIKRSVREIDELFHTLLQKTDYKAVVSTPLQELLFDEYIGLQLRKYDLINDKERDTIDKKDRYAMLHRYAVNYYLKDTTNRRASLLYAHELSKMNSSFTAIDSQQIADNTSAIQNTLTVVQPVSASDSASLRKLSQDLYNYHSLKSNFKDAYYASTAVLKYKDMDAGFWYNRSWYALFAGENEEAIEAAKKTLELDKNRDGVHTNLALGYVLNDQWEKAEEVYLNWKSKVFKDHNRPANTMFLEDIAALEKAGISHHDFIKVKELFK
jgi:tetratricopeptide (TPR) repeat protein